MPDITMCINDQCPLKNKCYRATAAPGPRQSFARFLPEVENGEVVCENFMPVWGEYDD